MDGESQDERAQRIEGLWRKLDTRQEGQLDLTGLQKGLRKIDHRMTLRVAPFPLNCS